MAVVVNAQRRDELADAAIEIVVRNGLHGLSHRAVDEHANVPRGTTSNYFRTRDALLEATTRRLVALHFTLMEQRRPQSGKLDRQALIKFLSGVLDEALTRYPGRYQAMLELALESTRKPEMRQAFIAVSGEAMKLTYDTHETTEQLSREEVELLGVFYNGVLFTCLTMPEILNGRTPGQITRAMLEKLLQEHPHDIHHR